MLYVYTVTIYTYGGLGEVMDNSLEPLHGPKADQQNRQHEHAQI